MASNQEISQHLLDIVFFYKQESQPFRAKAYEKAADILVNHVPLTFKNGVLLTALAGVGDSITTTIEQFNSTGSSDKFQTFIKAGYAPPEVQELQRIPQVGPATAKKLWKKFGIVSMQQFGEKIEEIKLDTDFSKYVAGYLKVKDAKERLPAGLVRSVVDQLIIDPFTKLGLDVGYAGSMRRKRETIRDVDVIVCLHKPEDRVTLKQYLETAGLKANVRDGEDKLGIDVPVSDQTITLDLNFCTPESRGAYYMYLTGSKEFNVELRSMMKSRGLLLNQNGLFKGDTRIAGASEREMFDAMKVAYIPPECREEGCIGKDFTNLVTNEDIIADLHSHSLNSDGAASWDQMAQAAQEQGLKLLGFSDHSTGSGGGMKPEDAASKVAEFRAASFPLKTLYGAEIDVRVDGTLDYEEKVVDQLDYFLIAAHHGSDKKLEERFTGVLEKYPTKPKILAHPTGRKIGGKEPAEADWDKIFEACKKNNTLIEVNGQPERRDLPPELIRKAITKGVYFVINSDCHGTNFRRLLAVGVETARRGWLTKDRVVNCSDELLTKWLENRLYT